jgi:GntR family transcriptional repressor for pyruvate dehydrogenase complex
MSDVQQVEICMQLRPLAAQPSRVDQVANRIRQFVERGELQPGARLPSEPELAEKLKISRNVLREAIKRLESIGLLSVRRGLGTFVGDGGTLSTTTKLVRSAMAFSPRDVTKVAELRRAIECDAVRTAAVNATDADLAELDTIFEKMKTSDTVGTMQHDLEFHMKIVGMADNPLLTNVMNVIQEFIYAGMVQTRPVEQDVPYTGDQHLDILKGLRERNPDKAERAMRFHMDLLTRRLDRVEEVSKPDVGASQS